MKKIIKRLGIGYISVVVVWLGSVMARSEISWITETAALTVGGYIIYLVKGGEE